MTESMQEAEKSGQINRLQISGNLLADVSDTMTSTSKRILKTRLMAHQREKKESMYLDVTVWASDLSEEQIAALCAWKQGNSVVVTGKLTYRTWNGRVYLGIDATVIE